MAQAEVSRPSLAGVGPRGLAFQDFPGPCPWIGHAFSVTRSPGN